MGGGWGKGKRGGTTSQCRARRRTCLLGSAAHVHARRHIPTRKHLSAHGATPHGEEKCCDPRRCPQPGRKAAAREKGAEWGACAPLRAGAWKSVVTRQCSCTRVTCHALLRDMLP